MTDAALTTRPARRAPHWYFTYTVSCVICGATTTTRERQYGEKPSDPMLRYEFRETGCQGHFL